MSYKSQSQHGRHADKPHQIPLKGWKEILLRVKNQINIDHVQIVAAGVAFYFFLALFPFISVGISLYGLVFDASQIQSHLNDIMAVLPSEAADTVSDIFNDILSKSETTLGWSLALSIALSLYSANKGTSSLFEGINIAYDETIERGFIWKTVLTLLFTLGFILVGLISLFVMLGLPVWVEWVNNDTIETIVFWLRWPLLALLITFTLAVLYKVAPDRDNPEFTWVSWGSVIATLLWLGGSWGFSFYVENYAGYSEAYGNLAAVVILLMWFFLTSFIVLLGAEINSEMEHQTQKDTTTGPDEPMGDRGAFHADHVAAGETKTQSKKSKRRGAPSN